MTIRAVVKGVGHYLPETLVPNSELETLVQTSDEWIRTRSGIERRHFAAEGQRTSDLAIRAAKAALADAGIGHADDVDAIVLATSTADLTFPSAATMVQAGLGMTRGFAFDVQAVCAGFVYAMANANALILSGQAQRILVIGAETFSKLMDWSDRSTCVLFGDGAGAVLLEAVESEGTSADRGILACDLHSDGRFRDLLYVDGGVSTGTTGYLRMQGKEVFRHAVEKLAETAHTALEKVGLTSRRCRLDRSASGQYPYHRGNRKADAGSDGPRGRNGAGSRQYVCRLDPACAVRWQARGQIKPGDLVVTEAIGGGLGLGIGRPALVS
jgi:3-oxoacyl-[acyl-carrier-protein] synthase III